MPNTPKVRQMIVELPRELDGDFRKRVSDLKDYHYGNGAIKESVVEALTLWLKETKPLLRKAKSIPKSQQAREREKRL